mgnify:CR=1 FL=1
MPHTLNIFVMQTKIYIKYLFSQTRISYAKIANYINQ